MQPGRIDAVVLDIVLPGVDAVLDPGQELAPDGLGAVLDHRVERRLQRIGAVTLGERHHPPRSQQGRADLGVEVAAQMLRQARVALDDAERRLVHLAALVELDRRDHQPLRPHVLGVDGQAARHRAAYVVVMAEDLGEADQPSLVEDRQGGAEVRDVADAARGVVGVVPEEHVPGFDVVFPEILEHRLDQRRVGPPGELAPLGVEQGDPVVVLVADHRRPRGAFDRRLDFELGRADGAGDDLELDRPELPGLVPGLAHEDFSRMRLPYRSTVDRQVSGTTVVDPYSSTMAGPVTDPPTPRSPRRQMPQSIQPVARQ